MNNNHNQQYEELEEKLLQDKKKKKRKMKVTGKGVFEVQKIIQNKGSECQIPNDKCQIKSK